jgi:hypothetical protein
MFTVKPGNDDEEFYAAIKRIKEPLLLLPTSDSLMRS